MRLATFVQASVLSSRFVLLSLCFGIPSLSGIPFTLTTSFIRSGFLLSEVTFYILIKKNVGALDVI